MSDCKKHFKGLHCVQKHLIIFKWFFALNGFTMIYMKLVPGIQTLILIAGVFGVKIASDTFMKYMKEKNGNGSGEK